MPLVNLRNGKTVYLTVEQWLNFSDEDEQYLVSLNYGASINNPWFGSAAKKMRKEKSRDFEEQDKADDDFDGSHLRPSIPEDEFYEEPPDFDEIEE